ncbi:ATP-binding protein [Desmonostoc muscorum LEGE 12446]|nr:ATP-binding protein [Desmonostoc muscorum]MCF2148854.1 ATP-binding protein [Desmonostoc muscorum LEGE 12446]
MNVNEVLQFVERLVVEKTGKHLNDVQKAVVEGTWQRQTYDDIAQKCHVTEGHVGDVGAELWQLLSETLGEDIKKYNFRSTLERINIESSQNPNICIGTNNYFNLSSQTINHPNKQNKASDTNSRSELAYHDLILTPKIVNFYARETELKNLSNWILNQNIRLISVLGLSGIGKTTLVKRFVDSNLDQFEVIIWKNLKFPKSLDLLVNNLLNTCQQKSKDTIDDKLKQLFDIFTDKKCLIILDDVQNIFTNSEFSGQYQHEYKNYQTFFSMITEIEHQSHIILISQEQCPEMECLDEELYPIRCLELSGLDNTDILKNTGLQDEESWLNFINLYEGNLMYFKTIITLINKNYDGKVADFLAENILHLPNKMQSHFQEIFNHLSPTEQEIVLQLSKFEQSISREELRQSLNLSSVDFNNGLQSLQQRYLVTKIKNDKRLFQLSSVFREYVRNYC